MKTEYDELTLTHNLSGVILRKERYHHVYLKGEYLILPVIALYNDKLDKDATRTEVHKAEENTKPRKMTVRTTKRRICPGRTSSWK